MDDHNEKTRESEKNQERSKSAESANRPGTGKSGNDGDDVGAMVADTVEQAKTVARSVVGEQAWSAAASAGAAAQDMARSAGTAAQDMARKVRDNATDTIYEQGSRAGQYLTRNVNEYPLAALLIAGAVGYGIAYLMHSSWQGNSDSSSKSAERRPARQRD